MKEVIRYTRMGRGDLKWLVYTRLIELMSISQAYILYITDGCIFKLEMSLSVFPSFFRISH